MFNIICSICQSTPTLNTSATAQAQQIDPFGSSTPRKPADFMLLDCCFTFICTDCLGKQSSCGECSEPLSGVQIINCNDDLMLTALMKVSSAQTDGLSMNSSVTTCERCSLYVSQYHCAQCQAYLCDGCNSLLHSLGLFSTHNQKKFNTASQNQTYQYMSELEKCDQHLNQDIQYFAPSLNKFGCQLCYQQNTQAFKKLNSASSANFNLSQKKQDIEKEMQTSLSYLSTIIERNNNFATQEIQNKKRELSQSINDVVERLISTLRLKQQDLLEQCNSLFQAKTEEISQKTSKVKKSRDTIERNYSAIKILLNIIPENILRIEEPFIKKISQHNISILEDIQRQYGTKHQIPLFNVPQLSEDLITRVDEAIKELNINKLSILTDNSGIHSYRSPHREEYLQQVITSKTTTNNTKKNSSSNVMQSSYQKYNAQKRDKSLNNSQSQHTQIMFKTSTHSHVPENRNKELKDFTSFDNNGQAKNTSTQLVSAPLTALQSYRGQKQGDESGNLRSDRHASQINTQSKGKSQLKDNSFQKPTVTSTTNQQSRKRGAVNQQQTNTMMQISNSKQRRTSCEQTSPIFKGAQANNAILNQSNQQSRDHSNNFRKHSGGLTSSNNNYNTMGQGLSQPPSLQNTAVGMFPENQEIVLSNIEEHQHQLDTNPYHKRVFTHIAQTSTAIQVAWSHPVNFSKNHQNSKQHLQYILQYGIGVKVNNTEQFRQIYKGKAHKCIITDLMPRTTYRFRVAPIIISEDQTKPDEEPTIEQGEWSDISNIATRDNQAYDVVGSHCASFATKGSKKLINFEKAGTMITNYGYSFGEHLWALKISYQQNSQCINNNPLQSISNTSTVPSDMGGIMFVGVINKRFSSSKLIGSVINYSLLKGNLTVKILLDANKKRLIIYTPNNPQGEVFSDLPKDGLFYPAIQNKSKLMKNLLNVSYKFEIPIPKDKNEIPGLNYSSSEDNCDDDYNEDEDLLNSDRGGDNNRKQSSCDEINSEQQLQV